MKTDHKSQTLYRRRAGAANLVHRWAAPVFLCLFFSTVLFAQLPDYHLQTFDHAYGIHSGYTVSLARDAEGFLWIAQPRYVQCFDGKRVRNFKVNTSVNRLFCDSKGGVWASSYDKIYRYHRGMEGFSETQVNSRDTVLRIAGVFERNDGSVWAFCHDGAYRWNGSGFDPVDIGLPIAGPYGVRSFNMADSVIYFPQKRRMYAFHLQRKTLDSLPDPNTFRIFPIAENRILVSTWNQDVWLLDFRNARSEVLKMNTLPVTAIRGAAQLDTSRFILFSREGTLEYRIADGFIRPLTLAVDGLPFLQKDFTNHVISDRSGDIWLATIDGVARLSPARQGIGLLRLPLPDENAQASINNIRRIVPDNRGNWWLATGNGLACWETDAQRWSFLPPVQGRNDRLAHPSVRGMVFDGRRLIIGPADLGVWLLDPVTRRFERPKYPSGEAGKKVRELVENDFIDEITTLRNGDHLVMGRDAIYRINGKNYLLELLDIPAGKENSNFAFQDKSGLIWICTARGVHCLDTTFQTIATVPFNQPNTSITSGFMQNDDRLLLASFSGIFQAWLEHGTIRVEKVTDLFDNQLINIVYRDEKNAIWMCGESGIVRYDPASGQTDRFDYSDQVQGYGFNPDSWFRDSSGQLFFGGANGINYLLPESFPQSDGGVSVFFGRIQVGDKSLYLNDLSKNLELSYRENSVEVEFTAPYFNNPEKIMYRYRVEGLDTDWRMLGNNNVLRLSSVPAGNYTLRVQASTDGVHWQESPERFAFVIRAPFWVTTWFVFLVLAVMGGAVWWGIRQRNRQIQEQREALEAEKAINYLSTSMYAQNTVDEILWDVARNCIGRLQFEDCVIYLFDNERSVLIQTAAHGPKSPKQYEISAPIEIPVGMGIVGAVAATGQAEIIADTLLDPRYITDDIPRRSEISVPIISGNEVLGVIDCEHSKPNFFNTRHLSILTTIASLCAGKIVRAQAEAEKQVVEQSLFEVKRQMQETEMQALRAQMNPHFIFNCLNSINRYIVKSDQATASLYLTRFAKLIRLILDNSNSKNVALSNELEALRLYIEMESLRFSQKFTWQIVVDESVSPDSIEVPPLIIQPFVENAIWHGLLHKDEAGHLDIRLRMIAENMLECVVEDNGIGREKAHELKSKSATTRKSLGMQLTENRLSLLNRHAQLNARIEITDLTTPENISCGTRVVLHIPV